MRPRLPDPRRIEVVDPVMARILRSKTTEQRIAMVFACNRTMRSILHGALETQHPDWTEAQIQREIARRMLGGTGRPPAAND
jgi:hypothetical protein